MMRVCMVKTRRVILVMSFLLFAWSATQARGTPPPLMVNEALERQSVTRHLSYLVDPTGRAHIEEMAKHTDDFKPLTEERGDPSFGYSRHPHWFMFRVRNENGTPVEWILEFSYPLIDRLELYVPEGKAYRVMRGGDRLPSSVREVASRTIAFPLTEPPGERAYFLRVESSGSLTVPLVAWSPRGFHGMEIKETILLGLSYGILIAMAIYHLFIFISIREKSYLYLSMMIIAVTLFGMTNTGLSYQYLWPENHAWGNMVHPFFLALANLLALQFTRTFLAIRARFPRGDLLPLAAMAICALLMPLSLLIEYYHASRATVMLTGCSMAILITMGIVSLSRGYHEARYYLMACLVFFIGVILAAVRAYGLLPDNFITAWSSQIGIVAMALLFSFGVADKINVIRREREKAVEGLSESEKKYRTLVESAH
ncbi:MAG: hypothetical protein E4G96_05675, partial [Chrysiogenales bacterium]